MKHILSALLSVATGLSAMAYTPITLPVIPLILNWKRR